MKSAQVKSVNLADVFDQIEEAGHKMDEIAGQILLAAQAAKATTLDLFNEMVYAAYDAKGWSRRMGRPMEGDVPAPQTVRVYISTIRAAYNNGVKVLDHDSIGSLRKALRSAKSKMAASSPMAAPVAPELKGVETKNGGKLIGAPFHDIVELYKNLPEKFQIEILEKVSKMVTQYTKKAPPALRLVA